MYERIRQSSLIQLFSNKERLDFIYAHSILRFGIVYVAQVNCQNEALTSYIYAYVRLHVGLSRRKIYHREVEY